MPLYLAKTSKILQQHHKVRENIATLVGLNMFLTNIMNSDLKLLFHIIKVKYLKILYSKYSELVSISFLKKLFRKYLQKNVNFWVITV